MANPEDRQVQGMQKTSLGLLAGGHKLQANPGEAAFSTPCSCQQGTPGKPRSRRGRKTWRKTNLHLLLPPGKTKKRRKPWKRSCVAAAALAETSLQPPNSTLSGVFALGPPSLPQDQSYSPPPFSLLLSPFGEQNTTQNRAVSTGSLPLPVVTPSLLYTVMERNITAIYNRWIFFFIITGFQSK